MKSGLRLAAALVLFCALPAPASQPEQAATRQSAPSRAQDHAVHHGQGQATSGDHHEHRFENAEEWAKNFDDPARDQWQMPARVIDTLKIAPGQIVADIGAGTGYFTVRLAKTQAKAKVYAVDIEKSMVEHVGHRALREGLTNIVAIQAEAERTNLPEPVDLALIVDTYHHLPNRASYFANLKTSLKPGAQVAIIDFRKDAPTGPPKEFRFTAEQITAEMAKAGFRLHAKHDFLPHQLFLIFRSAP
jgi:ubiquinone/menaquinone biosynthesis C-methylase UbiE